MNFHLFGGAPDNWIIKNILYFSLICSHAFGEKKKPSPVNDVVETAGLGHGQVLAVIAALARSLWVEVL